MHEFRECLAKIEVSDVAMSGLKFTWNKSPGKVDGLLKKLESFIDLGFRLKSLEFRVSNH